MAGPPLAITTFWGTRPIFVDDPGRPLLALLDEHRTLRLVACDGAGTGRASSSRGSPPATSTATATATSLA
ncbi:MAG: hypothetical protein H6710_20635 [Myxococcales bacterium]|nr:hypothetical protein [Myxococcales bacterium]